jgi:hypothetical protein
MHTNQPVYLPPPNLPPKRKSSSAGKVIAIVSVLVVGLAVLGAGGFFGMRYLAGKREGDAVVRVVTPHGSGTGFFISGPDDHAYVATAFHVVESGERILIERNVPGAAGSHYVEAFPETEVVAFDAESDLAIVRIKNLRADTFPRLPLAEQPMANEVVRSYGFPGSKITRRTGLIAKDGKLLSLVKFPVFDRRNARVVRENAVDGLLVSTDIEPGFSGGPTVNDAGEVVGVNVTKDAAHVGQNGVVHVKLLKQLAESIKPVADSTEPSAEQIAALLTTLQRDVLLLPVPERVNEPEHSFISTAELPQLSRLIDELRRHERDSHRPPERKLSGRAAFGVWAAQLPGRPLETYMSEAVQESIAKCERSSARLVSIFSEVVDDKQAREAEKAALDACDELAQRPLAWDLLAATLQWTGQEKSYTVSRVERVDDESNVFRASVRVSGISNLLTLWLSTEYGQLRVKLFDNEGRLYGVKSAADPEPAQLSGEWELKQARAPALNLKDAEQERVETLSVTVTGRDVSVKHVVKQTLHATDNALFRCNASATIETGYDQGFAGKLEGGAVIATPKDEGKRIGADSGSCTWGYRADAVAVFKLIGDKLVMYRSDGLAYPESVEFSRKKDEPKDSKKSD